MKDTTSSNVDKETSEPDGGVPVTDGSQLSKLSSVLNGLEHGASAIRRHVMQAMRAVRSGTYMVDPVQLSRRIVGETVGSARKIARMGQADDDTKIGSPSLPPAPSQF